MEIVCTGQYSPESETQGGSWTPLGSLLPLHRTKRPDSLLHSRRDAEIRPFSQRSCEYALRHRSWLSERRVDNRRSQFRPTTWAFLSIGFKYGGARRRRPLLHASRKSRLQRYGGYRSIQPAIQLYGPGKLCQSLLEHRYSQPLPGGICNSPAYFERAVHAAGLY